MSRRKPEPADYIIAGIIMIPVLFDFVAWRKGWKTVSVRWGNFQDDPKTKLLMIGGWAVLSLHLFWKMPLPLQTKLKYYLTKDLQREGNKELWKLSD